VGGCAALTPPILPYLLRRYFQSIIWHKEAPQRPAELLLDNSPIVPTKSVQPVAEQMLL
jgi:hypothetical protein